MLFNLLLSCTENIQGYSVYFVRCVFGSTYGGHHDTHRSAAPLSSGPYDSSNQRVQGYAFLDYFSGILRLWISCRSICRVSFGKLSGSLWNQRPDRRILGAVANRNRHLPGSVAPDFGIAPL